MYTQFDNITKIYESRATTQPTIALQNVSLEIAKGELVVLLGPSGCGKTTLLKMLAGFEAPTNGTVQVDKKPVTRPGPDRGTIFQSPTLFPWLTVMDNVLYGPRARGKITDVIRGRARTLLGSVGLKEFEEHLPHNLSGGMQQRVAIARALINDPEILLADEPFAALDEYTRRAMQELFLQVATDQNRSLLFVTHSIEEAVYLADRIVIMSPRPGRITHVMNVAIAHPRQRSSREFLEMMGNVFDAIGDQAQEAAE